MHREKVNIEYKVIKNMIPKICSRLTRWVSQLYRRSQANITALKKCCVPLVSKIAWAFGEGRKSTGDAPCIGSISYK